MPISIDIEGEETNPYSSTGSAGIPQEEEEDGGITEGDPPQVPGGGNKGGGGTQTSGGFSGSSFDPFDWRDLTAQAMQEKYFSIWGVFPPEGYVRAMIKKGMNVFEMEDFERRKPAFKKTETYENEGAAFAQLLSRLMGTR